MNGGVKEDGRDEAGRRREGKRGREERERKRGGRKERTVDWILAHSSDSKSTTFNPYQVLNRIVQKRG